MAGSGDRPRKPRATRKKATATRSKTAKPLEPKTLDEAAAMLVQAGPESTEALSSVRTALFRIGEESESAGATEEVLEPLANAVRALDDWLENRRNDGAAALAEVGQQLDRYALATAEPHPAAGQSLAERQDEQSSEDSAPAEETGDRPDHVRLPDDADPDLVSEYVTESLELLEGAEEALLAVEADPGDLDSVNTVFRSFHTIKGTSAFLGLAQISELGHRAENLLCRMRDREIRCEGGYADLALRCVDALKELIEGVKHVLRGTPLLLPDNHRELMRILEDPEAAGYTGETTDSPPRVGDLLVAVGDVEREHVERVASEQSGKPLGVALVRDGAAKAGQVVKALRAQRKLSGSDGSETSVRVRTERLDHLIDLVGELVIAHSMVAQDRAFDTGAHVELQKKIGRTSKIVRDLQDLSMSLRMVPLKAMFQKVARVVRDITHRSGKQVEFVTDGEDTEIDRNMVDVVSDPLLHMVRNAVDHGIEQPDEREAAGKSRVGRVHLSAHHASGNVVLELRDDGRGLDREKIAAKGVERGVIESDKGMTDSDVFSLTFEAGLSTADRVTEVSGRGVGLDVVRRNIDALQGRVEIQSERGAGTAFSVRLPLTLAITDSMLVKVGNERYVIPTLSISTSFRPPRDVLPTVGERGEIVRLRDGCVPLIRLSRLFELEQAIQDPTEGLLVVMSDGDQRFALLVDELLGQQQVVAKSLGLGIGRVPGISGAAILGDGRVGLILDPAEIAALGRQSTHGSKTTQPASARS